MSDDRIITLHRLKTWPPYFAAVLDGSKTFEVRYNGDRGFAVGDVLELVESSTVTRNGEKVDVPSGRTLRKQVTYVLDLDEFLAPLYTGETVVLGLGELAEVEP